MDSTTNASTGADPEIDLFDLWADGPADAIAPICTLGTSSSISTAACIAVCVSSAASGGTISSSC
jgi:hypothetical protein